MVRETKRVLEETGDNDNILQPPVQQHQQPEFNTELSSQTISKKMKFFDFMNNSCINNTSSKPVSFDVLTEFHKMLECKISPEDSSNKKLAIFNKPDCKCFRSIALQLFSAPCSSAASERVFSQAGLIMKPTRSRLSKEMLSKLVFLKCNRHLEN